MATCHHGWEITFRNAVCPDCWRERAARRDMFAGHALAGILAHHGDLRKVSAVDVWSMADIMLEKEGSK